MNVLVVDPDPVGAGALEAAITARGWGVPVEIRADIASAEAWLEERHPAVVFLELDFPGGAGMEFLLALKERQRPLPVVVWSDHALLDDLTRMRRSLGPLQLHRRSVPPETLVAGVRRHLVHKPESRIHGLDPGEFLALLAREHKTCRVRMSVPAGHGDAYLRDGELVHAELMGLVGEAAFREMMAMPQPELAVFSDLPPRIRTIRRSLSTLRPTPAAPTPSPFTDDGPPDSP